MAQYSEPQKVGDVLKREYDKLLNREQVTYAQGSASVLGTVLGKVTATGKYVPLAPAAADGSQNAVGILLQAVDTTVTGTNADTIVAIEARGPSVVESSALNWGAATAPQIAAATAQLVALGIIVRTGVGAGPVTLN